MQKLGPSGVHYGMFWILEIFYCKNDMCPSMNSRIDCKAYKVIYVLKEREKKQKKKMVSDLRYPVFEMGQNAL